MVSFAVQKLLNLMESHLFIFTFCYLCFWCQGAKKQRSFTVLGLMSKSLMLFWVCVWCKIRVLFHSFAWGCPVLPAPFMDILPFPIVRSWLVCCKLIDHVSEGLFLGSLVFWPMCSSGPLCFGYHSFGVDKESSDFCRNCSLEMSLLSQLLLPPLVMTQWGARGSVAGKEAAALLVPVSKNIPRIHLCKVLS